MYRHILFDLDGTLTDPFEGITNSVVHALKRYNIEVTDKRELRSFIGPPLVESFMKYFNFTEADAKNAVEVYREHFGTKGLFENAVYDGVEEMLTKLKERGKKLVIATSKPEVFTFRILKHFDLEKYFDFIAGATLDISRAKKADVIAYALEKVNPEDKAKVIMVGDRDNDVQGAKANGIDCIGVLYGYGDEEELTKSGAKSIVKTPLELLEVIK